MASWDDYVFGIATGGLYNLGKGAVKAGEAAEEVGSAVAVIGKTITDLGRELGSFINELEDLITIERPVPRNEDDLWDEEVERLAALRNKEQELLNELTKLGANDDDQSWYNSFWGSIFGQINLAEITVRTKLAVVRAAINEILYEEPGVVPRTIHNVQEILERFHTLDQPRIEEILDSLNDNLEESQGILQQVNKLFVVKTFKAVPIEQLSPVLQAELKDHENSLSQIDALVAGDKLIAGRLVQNMIQVQPKDFKLPKLRGASPGVLPDRPGAAAAAGPKRIEPWGASWSIKRKVSPLASQTLAGSVGAILNRNEISAFHGNSTVLDGRMRFFGRERLKIEKKIFRIKFVVVEEPGIIPKTLASANEAVIELKNTLGSVNKVVQSVQVIFDYLFRNKLIIKIALYSLGGTLFIYLIVKLIELIRNVFGI
jgi:hypothetical protein